MFGFEHAVARNRGFSLGLLALGVLIPGLCEAAAQEDLVLVLGLSGSMWGRVEGTPKIRVAREAVAEMMLDWPPGRPMGLLAYGHRRARDCSDIEMLIPPGPVEPEAFAATVRALVPRGVAPLAEALRQAAEALHYRDAPAGVILVSDGTESCDADPCAVAAELERGGAGFTAHVIGFAVDPPQDQDRLRCVAAATGGRFYAASGAAELVAALRRASRLEPLPEPADPRPFSVTLRSPERVVIGAEFPVYWSGPGLDDDYIVLTAGQDPPGRHLASARTSDGNPARLRAPDQPGRYQVHYLVAESRRIAATAQLQVADAEATLKAPAAAPAGSELEVHWRGPGNRGDHVTLVARGADDQEVGTYVSTAAGSPAGLRMPERAGGYELRYVTGQARRVLARLPIQVTDGAVQLDAPSSALMGASIQVAWRGPGGRNDYISIAAANAEERRSGRHASVRHGSPARLNVPEQPGEYEIRYVAGKERQVLARVPLVVQAVAVSLEAPDFGLVGNHVEVTWSGPGNRRDLISIAPMDAPARKGGNYVYADQGSPARLLLPDQPGDYEIRYLTAHQRLLLARRPIQVRDMAVTLEINSEVRAGERFEVVWSGPDGRRDRIAVVDPGAGARGVQAYTYTRDGSPLRIEAPARPGSYELRYLTGQTNRVLQRSVLRVEPGGAP